MKQAELIETLSVQNKLGEGVIWDAAQGAAWWTDIQGSRIYRYLLEDRQLDHWQTPERLGCFAPVAGRDCLIAAFASGFAYFDPTTGKVERLQSIEEDTPNTRLNDGRTDRQGRFWAGGMVEGSEPAGISTGLYCLDQQHQCSRKLAGLSISNALCWSPDSRYLYHADTPSQKIDRYDFDTETAELSHRETFVETDSGAFPDGACIDSQGYLWNAQWGGSQVVRYSPAGDVDLIVPLPVSQVTCVAFGGPDLNLLFVTSARQGLDAAALAQQPEAGNVFIYATDVVGLEESEFQPEVF